MKMKEFLYFAQKSIYFVIGFLIFVYILDMLIGFSVRKINVGEYGVLNKIDDGAINADILISGSSRALKAINPQIITQETGMSCFNIASDGSDLGVQFPKLKWYLNKNRKPRILIQDVSQFGGEISTTIYEPYKYVFYLSDDSLYYGLKQIDQRIWIHKYLFPSNLLYYNFDFYTRLFSELHQTLLNQDKYINGYLPDNSRWAGNFELFKKERTKGINCYISQENVNYLYELKEYCENQRIILILIVLPNYYRLKEITHNAEEISMFYAKLENIPYVYYLNYVNIELASLEDNFYNFTHLNADGASKFSTKLAADLIAILK